MRRDSYGAEGVMPGTDPHVVTRQLFVEAGVDFAIVLPIVNLTVDPTENAAISTAFNHWQADTWLSVHNASRRFFGSIVVAVDDPVAAALEIENWASHPSFKQVLIGHHSDRPLGFPQYDPIWAAAAKHGLPIAMHFGGDPSEQLGATPVGPFEHYVDYHSIAFPLAYSAHLLSWICGGTFDRHPNLRVVFVEGGFLWYRPLLTRLACHWNRTSEEVPSLKRGPLEYVADHVRFTSQPVEEAEDPRDVVRLLELADAARVLMFSSDYPHYDFDNPRRALPAHLDQHTKARIMAENARELYSLPETRQMDVWDTQRVPM
jgi:predicted TIM-barrel fold metal-dependent hydrolase